LLDTENIHICITGSSSRLLSREIATSLRGRSIATEIFPFSFREMLAHIGIEIRNPMRVGTKKKALLENKFQKYLLEGGFPEVQGIQADLRLRILQDYLNVVILRDVVERHQMHRTIPLRYLIRHLLNSPACLFSVNKFYNDLKSQGISCSKDTLHDYLGHLSDAYLIFQIPIHTHSERVRMVNPKKTFIIDTGLIHACSHGTRPNWGHLLENFVFMTLRRSNYLIEYYKTAKGREVDFLATSDREDKPLFSLIQVATDLENRDTKNREIKALEKAMQECGFRIGTIVTMNQQERIETETGHIDIVPAWLWALKEDRI
jgi:predicted AAA+ superfamily ATPase